MSYYLGSMCSMEKFKLFAFNSTHQAMLMEKVIKDRGYAIRLIPIPRTLSASCGLAARVNIGDFEAIQEIAKAFEIDIAGVYDF